MKKILTAIVTLALTVAMAIPAWAGQEPAESLGDGSTANGTNKNAEGAYSLGVLGNNDPYTAIPTVISVDVAWESMAFSYTEGSKGSWNPQGHTYTGVGTDAWSTNKPAITVTNHSNAAVTVSFRFDAAVEGIIGSFTGEELLISSADNARYRAEGGSVTPPAPSGSTQFGIDPGSAPISATQSLGTVTVDISVYGLSEFQAELAKYQGKGGTVTLQSNLTVGDLGQLYLTGLGTADSPLVLDLNGYTFNGLIFLEDCYAILKNGSITYSYTELLALPTETLNSFTSTAELGGVGNLNSEVRLEQLTVSVPGLYAVINAGTLVAKDSVFTGGLEDHGDICSVANIRSLVFEGSITVSNLVIRYSSDAFVTLCAGGTYNLNGVAVSVAADTTHNTQNNDNRAWYRSDLK